MDKVHSYPVCTDKTFLPDEAEGASPSLIFDTSLGSVIRIPPDNNVLDVAVVLPGLGRRLATI